MSVFSAMLNFIDLISALFDKECYCPLIEKSDRNSVLCGGFFFVVWKVARVDG